MAPAARIRNMPPTVIPVRNCMVHSLSAPRVRGFCGPWLCRVLVTPLMRLVPTVRVDTGGCDVLRAANGRRVGAGDAGHGAALDRDALHVAALRIIVVDRVVLGRAVVPHRDRVRRPMMAELIFRDQRL